jgi:hypothetical protein
MTESNAVAPAQTGTKLLSIGRAWDNSSRATGKQPKMRIVLDRDLGVNITLSPGSQLLAFENNKREGKQDPDYRVAVALPTAIVDQEIARQRTAKSQAEAVAV